LVTVKLSKVSKHHRKFISCLYYICCKEESVDGIISALKFR
jgi:hypothetical protein